MGPRMRGSTGRRGWARKAWIWGPASDGASQPVSTGENESGRNILSKLKGTDTVRLGVGEGCSGGTAGRR